jgi:DNA-binding transcriptional LysR family regulator
VIDPRRLRLLVALERLGTVRAVAAEAALSPSAVSQQLAQLEREAGTALLARHGRRVTLTAAGTQLIAHARGILERIDAAEAALHAGRTEVAGTVYVGAFTSALRAFVVGAARDLRRAHPGLAVHLVEQEPHETVRSVVRGDVDLAVVAEVGDDVLPRVAHLRRIPLTHDDLLLVLPPDWTGDSGPVAWPRLRAQRWLVDGTPLERFILRSGRLAGYEPQVAGRLTTHGSLLLAVAAGLGVTVLPAFAVDPNAPVQTRPLDPASRRELFVLHRPETLTRRAVAVTLEAVVTAGQAVHPDPVATVQN